MTSRDSLAGLVARHGAQRLTIDLLPYDDALQLLTVLVGDRVAAEPAAAAGGIPSRRSAARPSVRWGRWSALQHAKRTPARTSAAAPEKS